MANYINISLLFMVQMMFDILRKIKFSVQNIYKFKA